MSLFHQLLLAFGRVIPALALDALEPRVAILEAVAREYQIEPARLLATCFVESGLRIRNTRAIFCGCGHNVVGDRAQAECAARSLAHGYAHCGTWPNALRRYRYGLAHHGCPRRDPEQYAPRVMRVAGRLGGAR